MKLIFVHQNFPGQYKHILNYLSAEGGHQLIGLGINELSTNLPKGVRYIRYQLNRGNTPAIHPLVLETETKCIRGEACAYAAAKLKKEGFTPDLICAHPGWGESLFLKDIWPNTPLLSYQEFYYRAFGFDYAFDPEFGSNIKTSWQSYAGIRMKTAFLQLVLQASDWNVTPTRFQRSSFPTQWQNSISPIHDGINTAIAKPSVNKMSSLTLPDGTSIGAEEPLVTFVNRAIEPYRGCHTFIRAIPQIQQLVPQSKIVIVGEEAGDSYGSPPENGTWKEHFLAEIEGCYNTNNVHFTGSLRYEKYIEVLQHSWAHVYFTYPFVLSWSLLEAMSCGCAVVGSETTPVLEVLQDQTNGLTVDFFNSSALAHAVVAILKDRSLAEKLGQSARSTIVNNYSISNCIPKQLALIRLLASGSLFNH